MDAVGRAAEVDESQSKDKSAGVLMRMAAGREEVCRGRLIVDLYILWYLGETSRGECIRDFSSQ